MALHLIILEECMKFTWDQNKAKTNLEKHRVSFEEAATVFSDPLAITFNDPDHSLEEERFLTFGLSNFTKRRLLIVSHVDAPGIIRIISAREMTKHERGIYTND